jgi:hypothetical protein
MEVFNQFPVFEIDVNVTTPYLYISDVNLHNCSCNFVKKKEKGKYFVTCLLVNKAAEILVSCKQTIFELVNYGCCL